MQYLDKEQLISALYRMVNENDSAARKAFFNKEIDFDEHASKLFPIGAIDMIAKTVREFDTNG